ncbi:MAG: PQQ-dependent sugar dehydrogenase [Candidatus Liptonbacteria bacterium]|nr:PQQ-dependent sugar dehydrogenase [Candidatus Liptonbacteria bacterium]
MKKTILSILIICLATLAILFLSSRRGTNTNPGQAVNTDGAVTVVAQNLYVPWSMAFLPTGELLVTERNGILRVIGEVSFDINVPGAVEVGEGGLLGLAFHPNFTANRFIYLYFTARSNGRIINRVVRYVFENRALAGEKMIIDDIPGGTNHNGGRIAFGPDKLLYITTGDSGSSALAQDTNSLAGKILRLKDDGSIPPDNPFGNAVYSYGHRNPQGLAWDDEGNLWETEHGRSGIQAGLDELNLVEKGANYGWPVIQGDESRGGMKEPVVHSGGTTWAPSGIAFVSGKLYFAGLRGEALYEVEVMQGKTLGQINSYFEGVYGRLRGVAVGPDGALYLTTSNQDGRGDPREGDDKILKVSKNLIQ